MTLDPRPEAAIFDVDGTLCDVSSIRWMLGIGVDPATKEQVRSKNFDRFHEESAGCPPHSNIASEARWFHAQGYKILIVTARKSRWFNVTWFWLRHNKIPFDRIYMRQDWDQRKDRIVKQEILEQIIQQYRPVVAYDDNPNVIDLWRENNITTVLVPGWVE